MASSGELETASLQLAQARYICAAIAAVQEQFHSAGKASAIARLLREVLEIVDRFDCSLVFSAHATDLRAMLDEAQEAALLELSGSVPPDSMQLGFSAAAELLTLLGRPLAELGRLKTGSDGELLVDRTDNVSALAGLFEVAATRERIQARGDLHRRSQEPSTRPKTPLRLVRA
jgi:hypothetical protein